jgi:hypothetical protein
MASGLCLPHQQAAHMAAPTEGQSINKTLANGEPSTHGAKRTLAASKSCLADDPVYGGQDKAFSLRAPL